MERFVIVNADDFGLSAGINRGILRARREGIVTSAGLMVRYPGAEDAAQWADEIDLGLHIDLSEWIYRGDRWECKYQRVCTDDPKALWREMSEQLAIFQQLTGRLPSHIDSHQHVHEREPVRSTAMRLANAIGAPLRGVGGRIRYCGSFYGQSGKGDPCPSAITADSLIAVLASLAPGVTEVACHPGELGDYDSVYLSERESELAALCDPHVRAAARELNVRLIGFDELRRNEFRDTQQRAKRPHIVGALGGLL